jgi:hypothetical protein
MKTLTRLALAFLLMAAGTSEAGAQSNAFDRLNPADQAKAREVYDSLAREQGGLPPLTLDQLAAAKGDASWDEVQRRLLGRAQPARAAAIPTPAPNVDKGSAPEMAAVPALDESLPENWRADGPPTSLFRRNTSTARARPRSPAPRSPSTETAAAPLQARQPESQSSGGQATAEAIR